MAERKKGVLRFLQAIPGVKAALAHFKSPPALKIGAPISHSQPWSHRALPAQSKEADPAAAAAVAEALATLEGRPGPGLQAGSPKRSPSQSRSPHAERSRSEAQRMIAETQNTLDGRNGPGAHALPSWPSSPEVLPNEAAQRRGGVLFGPKEAGLEGLRERTLAEKIADFQNIKPLNGALPLPSWVTPPTPSNRLSSARSSTSSIERSDGFSARRTSISSATSRASMETTGLPYPSGIATAISIPGHRPTGLKKLNARAPGRTPEKLAYATASQVSVQAGLKPTKIEIVASGRATAFNAPTGKATLAPPERLSDRGERSRERDSHSR